MSIISNIIFGGADHYVTSPYGKRSVINTAAGQTASFHRGTDYGTNGKKLPQYAIEDGTVLSCGTASDGAKYVWVKYPRIGKKFLHYHLDSIAVKSGQAVKKGTLLGKTGKTGKATGVHLHLGIKDLQTDAYEDPEAYAKKYVAPTGTQSKSVASFFPVKGYFAQGDVSPNVGKIASFLYATFPAYTNKKALGNTYGKHLTAAVTEFQRRTGLVADGMTGEKTLAMLKRYGFTY